MSLDCGPSPWDLEVANRTAAALCAVTGLLSFAIPRCLGTVAVQHPGHGCADLTDLMAMIYGIAGSFPDTESLFCRTAPTTWMEQTLLASRVLWLVHAFYVGLPRRLPWRRSVALAFGTFCSIPLLLLSVLQHFEAPRSAPSLPTLFLTAGASIFVVTVGSAVHGQDWLNRLVDSSSAPEAEKRCPWPVALQTLTLAWCFGCLTAIAQGLADACPGSWTWWSVTRHLVTAFWFLVTSQWYRGTWLTQQTGQGQEGQLDSEILALTVEDLI